VKWKEVARILNERHNEDWHGKKLMDTVASLRHRAKVGPVDVAQGQKSRKRRPFLPFDEVLELRAQGVKWKEVARILNERHNEDWHGEKLMDAVASLRRRAKVGPVDVAQIVTPSTDTVSLPAASSRDSTSTTSPTDTALPVATSIRSK